MSGIEILGVAASVIQVAETGMRLSVKLFSFTRKVKRANKDIEALSHEIAITGAALQELGGTLSDHQSRQLCSAQALSTAGRLINDCNVVFGQLESVINPSTDEKKPSKVPVAQRLSFVFLESRIKELQANLERLKGSILVILNVLIFAQQLRTHEEVSILKDQRQLIQALVNENDAAQKRYNDSLKLLTPGDHPDASTVQPDSRDLSVRRYHKTAPIPEVKLPSRLERDRARIMDHGKLVSSLLKEISSTEYNIGLQHRSNLQDGVLDIHWRDWDNMRQKHGSAVFLELYDEFEDIARYWIDKADSETGHVISAQPLSPNSRSREMEYWRRGFARKYPARVNGSSVATKLSPQPSTSQVQGMPPPYEPAAGIVNDDIFFDEDEDDKSVPDVPTQSVESDEDMGFGLFDGPAISAPIVESDPEMGFGDLGDGVAPAALVESDEDMGFGLFDGPAVPAPLVESDESLGFGLSDDEPTVPPSDRRRSLYSGLSDTEGPDSSVRLLLEYSTLTSEEIAELSRGMMSRA